MSSDGDMDWSASPSTWAEVFEGADEEVPLPVPARPTEASSSSSALTRSPQSLAACFNPLDPNFIGLRYLKPPFINEGCVLETIEEAVADEMEEEPLRNGEASGEQDTEMKRSLSCNNIESAAEPSSIDTMIARRADNRHTVIGSATMQFASSMPNPSPTSPFPEYTRRNPLWGMVGCSTITGVVIAEKLVIPEVLRPRTDIPPKTEAQIRAMPLWAQPPLEGQYVRGDWGHASELYRSKIVREFGPHIFHRGEGWWQEVLKGEKGRIAVKSDDHYYTIYCYLPGQTLDCICLHSTIDSIGIQSDCYNSNDHFHWKVALPRASMKGISARLDGTTLTIQIQKMKFRETLEWLKFDPMTCMIAQTDIIPRAIYGLG